MKLTILDASVAIKFFIVEESGAKSAAAVLDEIKNQPEKFAVPELFFCEMLSVLCRLTRDARHVREYMDALQDLGLERVGHGRVLLGHAAKLACRYRLRGYDAIYLATAELCGGTWLTADHKAARQLHSNRHVRLLGP